jgi:NAD(P)-dependent dehydrogenase (short-subunit alcohol dehydrogenase family)
LIYDDRHHGRSRTAARRTCVDYGAEVAIVGIDLSGKVAIVTGAARGIGAATAELLAKAGATVVIGDVLVDPLHATAKRCSEAQLRVKAVPHDVTDEAAWESLVAGTIRDFGGLDILVNNAGIEETVLFADIEAANIERILAVNVEGVLFGHKYAIRAMRPGGASGRGGNIVNLSSVAGLIGHVGLGVYSASKGAVRLISKAAAVECGRLGFGIRVNSIHPGLIDTLMAQQMLADYVGLGVFADDAAAKLEFTAAHPLGRTGTPDDVASAILFLVSDLASFVTGHELVVDGGMSAS